MQTRKKPILIVKGSYQPVTIASDSGKRSKICNNMIEILAENINRNGG